MGAHLHLRDSGPLDNIPIFLVTEFPIPIFIGFLTIY